MSSWEVCFELANGRRICIPIPILVRMPPFDDPDPTGPVPDPWIEAVITQIAGPQPEPWIKDVITRIAGPRPEPWLPQDIGRDIIVLASMDNLVSQLSPELKAAMQPAIRDAITQRRLPDGVLLNVIEDATEA